MTEQCALYEGMRTIEARAKIVQDLQDKDLLVKRETLPQSVGTCWRCHTPVEFLVKDQWFVKVMPYKKNSLDENSATMTLRGFVALEDARISGIMYCPHAHRNITNAAERTIGYDTGNTTSKKSRTLPAPSISAACSISSGKLRKWFVIINVTRGRVELT